MIKSRQSVQEIKEYVAGKNVEEVAASYGIDEKSIIKLASNESCLGASPMAIEAIRKAACDAHVYPSVDAIELREALSAMYGVPVHNIVCGNGMDAVIETLLRAFLETGDETVIPLPAFSYYENVTRFCGATPRYCARRADFSLDIDALLEKVTDKTKFVFITSPNNPTGNLTSLDEIRSVAEAVDGIVFVDEAYIDFAGGKTALGLMKECDNVVIGRTMSKAWGLAGMRIGFGFMPDWIFKEYMKVATPFALSRIAIAAALAALKDKDHYHRTVETVKAERQFLAEQVPFKVYPSEANFVLMDTAPMTSKHVVTEAMKRGVILRDCGSFREMGDRYVRITVGTREQNIRLVEVLAEIKGSK
ncbi:histidinol-phosphate transaminase [Methanocella sp. MCL-LM]|uniref:histidinol-phosphate transaminase n=1 Tax=Methanocella sp. MCL-LM TaxID=3412035 RepID=UPI003C738433